MARVRIINTGGTIAMAPSPTGFRPRKGFLAEQMEKMDELAMAPMPEFDIWELDRLVDSSNITPAIWLQIARDIAQHYDAYDGFVVVHGTDTMAHTASALALMLKGLSKPVVLTGAQLPLGQLRSDARENLKTAMVLAAHQEIPEVSLFFNDRLLRGCRSTKVSSTRFDAFDSPNYPPLALAETEITILHKNIRPPDTRSDVLDVQPIVPGEIASFRLFPGYSVEVLKLFLQRPLKALVLETYGDGNGPSQDRHFLQALEEAIADGMVVVGCSQCLHGGVTQDRYATGQALANVGVISARDMTIEALLVKLLYLFSTQTSTDAIKQAITTNLVGEISPLQPDGAV